MTPKLFCLSNQQLSGVPRRRVGIPFACSRSQGSLSDVRHGPKQVRKPDQDWVLSGPT